MSEQKKTLGQELAAETCLVALHQGRFGRWRSYDDEERAKAAEAFNADPSFTKGSKKLLNDKCEEWKEVTAILNQARLSWLGMTIPYPETGRRLIRRNRIDDFKVKMLSLQGELAGAVERLDGKYAELRQEAEGRLKELYDESDYPATLVGSFSIDYEFPSAAPPEFLKQLAPELYQREVERVQARFDEAITLAEQAFASELARAVKTLLERLEPATVRDWWYEGPTAIELQASLSRGLAELKAVREEIGDGDLTEEQTAALAALEAKRDRLQDGIRFADASSIEQRGGKVGWKDSGGKRATVKCDDEEAATAWLTDIGCKPTGERKESKKIMDSSVGNLHEFFEKFRELSVRSNPQLDALVEETKAAVAGVDAGKVRAEAVDGEFRAELSGALSAIGDKLDEVIVSGGGRRIVFGQDMLIRTIKSSSSDRVYELHVGQDGRLYCTCPGWKFQAAKRNGMCKHVAAYLKEIAGGGQSQTPRKRPAEAAAVVAGRRIMFGTENEGS
jgi:hypothetical protein